MNHCETENNAYIILSNNVVGGIVERTPYECKHGLLAQEIFVQVLFFKDPIGEFFVARKMKTFEEIFTQNPCRNSLYRRSLAKITVGELLTKSP